MHLSLVVALLSCFDYKLRTAKSHAQSVRLTHLVPVWCTTPVLVNQHCIPSSPVLVSGVTKDEVSTAAALGLRTGLLQAAGGPKLLCPS